MLLVAYDIPDDRHRDRVAKALLQLGRRVQYSVFLVHRGTAEEVGRALAALIAPKEDNVRIYVLCAGCEAKSVLLGRAREAELPGGYRVI